MIRSSDKERLQKAEEIARQIWKLSRDKLLVNLRFLDRALSSLNFRAQYGLAGISCDGKTVFYDPLYVLEQYKKEQNSITRAYLHLLMHCIFNHSYHYGKLEQEKWDLAVDVTVENAILEPLQVRDSVLIADQLFYGFSLNGVEEGTQFSFPVVKDTLMTGIEIVEPWRMDVV